MRRPRDGLASRLVPGEVPQRRRDSAACARWAMHGAGDTMGMQWDAIGIATGMRRKRLTAHSPGVPPLLMRAADQTIVWLSFPPDASMVQSGDHCGRGHTQSRCRRSVKSGPPPPSAPPHLQTAHFLAMGCDAYLILGGAAHVPDEDAPVFAPRRERVRSPRHARRALRVPAQLAQPLVRRAVEERHDARRGAARDLGARLRPAHARARLPLGVLEQVRHLRRGAGCCWCCEKESSAGRQARRPHLGRAALPGVDVSGEGDREDVCR